MYLDFFSLKEAPFSVGNDPRFFFETDIHAEALANMVYAITHQKGMVLVTGEIGSGKTFLAGMLANRLGPGYQVVTIGHPPDSSKQLLRAMAEGLELKVSATDDKLTLVKQLQKGLERFAARRRPVAVIFDEAQDMPDEALEEVRLIWNWEHQGWRLLQVVLVGQPQLRKRLGLSKWESLQQRIVLSYHLGRLNPLETAKYVLHRRAVAAVNGSRLRFTIHALEYIHQVTAGVPRMINVLCDNALLVAYSKHSSKVTSTMVAQAAREMTTWNNLGPPPGEDTSAIRDDATGADAAAE